MEEQKKEEIKELLKKSASTDHFKEHKIEREKKKENTNSKDEKLEKRKTNKSNSQKSISKEEKKNLTLPVIGIFAILIFTAIVFLFNRQNEIIEDLQVERKQILESQKVLVEKEETTKENEVLVKTPSPKVETVIQIKEVIKEVKISDENLTKKKFKEFYNTRSFNKLTCYGYKAASVMPTTSCKEQMKSFLEKNKKAIRLEVIAVLGKDDINAFEGIENIKLENYSKSSKLKTYALRGLARDRVLELSWQIKQILGKDTILTPTNYFVESMKNNKGILIKAYH